MITFNKKKDLMIILTKFNYINTIKDLVVKERNVKCFNNSEGLDLGFDCTMTVELDDKSFIFRCSETEVIELRKIAENSLKLEYINHMLFLATGLRGMFIFDLELSLEVYPCYSNNKILYIN